MVQKKNMATFGGRRGRGGYSAMLLSRANYLVFAFWCKIIRQNYLMKCSMRYHKINLLQEIKYQSLGFLVDCWTVISYFWSNCYNFWKHMLLFNSFAILLNCFDVKLKIKTIYWNVLANCWKVMKNRWYIPTMLKTIDDCSNTISKCCLLCFT